MSERLKTLKAENDQTGLEMATEAGRFAALASRHEDGTAPKAISAFNLFQTPKAIAERMAGMLPPDAQAILEPSAGLGVLWQAVRMRKKTRIADITLVENSVDCCKELYSMIKNDRYTTLKQRDFLEIEPAREGNCTLILKDLPFAFYDAVIMNPPFRMGRDIKHILHALKFLKTGGLLVGLCYDGARQNKKLRPLCDTWDPLPAGSFKEAGTNAGVVLITMEKKL